ncbi:conserved hypothetical protein [Beutenbergia cavernae DSM 12333]|uniref:Glycosyltransferase RgtA/B/C/D-like domain-containing protein n=1 Tax=Beutenbergia cavernae (strain ATCC BAA-8 / DSM 12333 / CCUG 43141 / JCM 11478 / NBRC 16432 / NCIMB 13614 / HKI 0122) TaxID=471853 RepID=C5C2W8_BEUC1|nr:glycosyltransferase family 39 protein [Beutenbergia cavernae]ACQ81812.1 conserved hypothetical protein [Beutenbergia cavernae DSM 12333]
MTTARAARDEASPGRAERGAAPLGRAAREGAPGAESSVTRPAVAWRPVGAAVLALVVVLTVTSARYGYHRDELYFRMLEPAWGYVDQPPLTPLLVQAISGVVDEAWAIRVPATLCAAATVVVVALLARELGGGAGAQTLAAWGYAFAVLPLAFGHLMLTSAIDQLVWPAVLLFAVRALQRDDDRWWVPAGVVAGLATSNKLLVGVLVAGLLLGLAVLGPRRHLRSRGLLVGAAVAAVLALPAIVYQAANGFPQLAMGAALGESNAGDVRLDMWWFLLVMLGPLLVPVWVAGLVALLRRPAWRPSRCVAVAFAVVVAFTFAAGSQPYYPVGVVGALFAAGSVPVWEWATRAGRSRRALVVGGVLANAAVAVVVSLPALPEERLAETPVPAMNGTVGDQVGWPRYVEQVAAVYEGAVEDGAAAPAIIATNYGEAGAIARFGPDLGLPAPYSGHNALSGAAPPEDADVVVVVGEQVELARRVFDSCEVRARLDNDVDVDNEEQGVPVAVCAGRSSSWAEIWPLFAHLD